MNLNMENQRNIFSELFLNFVFSIGSNVLVFVAQISVSNKSYGCVDGIYTN